MKMRLAGLLYICIAALSWGRPALAVTINIDFGSPNSSSGLSSYGGSALLPTPTYWNAVNTADSQAGLIALLDSNGNPTGTTITQLAGVQTVDAGPDISPPASESELISDSVLSLDVGQTSGGEWSFRFSQLPDAVYDVYFYLIANSIFLQRGSQTVTIQSSTSSFQQSFQTLLGITNSTLVFSNFALPPTPLDLSGVCGTSETLNCGIAGIQLVSVSTVPIPATVWLFASGFLGLIGIARKKVA